MFSGGTGKRLVAINGLMHDSVIKALSLSTLNYITFCSSDKAPVAFTKVQFARMRNCIFETYLQTLYFIMLKNGQTYFKILAA